MCEILSKSVKTKKRKAKDEASDTWVSDTLKEKILSTFLHALEIDLLNQLWNMPQPEENFLNTFSLVSFTMLETQLKNKTLKNCVYNIIAVLTVKHNMSISITSSITQYLFKFDHSSSILAELFECFIQTYNHSQIIGHVLREFGDIHSREAQDLTGVKNLGSFLTELSEKVPKSMIPHIRLILPFLESEAYLLRNAVVNVIGQILNKALTKEKDSHHDTTKMQDSLFEILLARFYDITAYTRSKVLQVWNLLTVGRAIPLRFFSTVAKKVIERIRDKSSHVRKCAIQLLSSMLQYNPYGPQLQVNYFQSKLEEVNKTRGSIDESDRDTQDEDPEEVKQQKLSKFYQESISFIEHVQESLPTLSCLLGSNCNSDVHESIKFFMLAASFLIENVENGFKKILLLIWSRDNQIKEAVTDAFKRIIFTRPNKLNKTESKSQESVEIAMNMIQMTTDASLAELTSLEELITILSKKNTMPPSVIQALWDIFAMKIPNCTNLESRGALIVLTMIANAKPEIIKNKISTLLQLGLNERCEIDEQVGRYTCIALQKLARNRDSFKNENESKDFEGISGRLKTTHPVFERLIRLIENSQLPLSQWFPVSEQALNSIFTLCDNPDHIAAQIIRTLSKRLTQDTTEVKNCSSDLTKLIFTVGHVALKQLVHLEEVNIELRRRRSEKSESKRTESKKNRETIDDEMMMDGTAEERDDERLIKLEQDLISCNLLGTYSPLIIKIASSPQSFKSSMLRSAAIIALTKFMCVSSKFCETNMRLLFTILKKSNDSTIRGNIMISLGDLAIRFPNLIEPWTPSFSALLHDEDPSVRKNSLLVLTHLMLNDMIKAKILISDMAICLEDQDSRISALAKLFFHELSAKGNTIYNILPDVISRLSSEDVVCSSSSFKTIMNQLFTYIQKEKQVESLIEKLCQRFNVCKDTSQCQDIAYCLGLLNYNEKGLRKLLDMWKYYFDHLHDPTILGHFQHIANKSKKFAKPDMITTINEFHAKLLHKANKKRKTE
eukprot:TRINITY_DN2462_c0_g1_i1.p1 TRINITY_DN2462_c0_g1~~TRINITY_DN2462_c0_g1_i1.p1  ORF type:complete len:1011 (+),score=148.98 TRINITY_DN2462_c0_g1_i1:371-3403(+)